MQNINQDLQTIVSLRELALAIVKRCDKLEREWAMNEAPTRDVRNEQVWGYLRIAAENHYLKDDFSLNCSRTEAAVLAWIIGKSLFGKPHWRWFEALWGVHRLGAYYNKATYLGKFEKLEQDLNKMLKTASFSK